MGEAYGAKQAFLRCGKLFFVNNFHELDKQNTCLLCVAAPFRMQNTLNFELEFDV